MYSLYNSGEMRRLLKCSPSHDGTNAAVSPPPRLASARCPSQLTESVFDIDYVVSAHRQPVGGGAAGARSASARLGVFVGQAIGPVWGQERGALRPLDELPLLPLLPRCYQPPLYKK